MRKTWRCCLGWMAAAVCLMMTADAAAETSVAWLGDTCGSLSGGYGGLSAQMEWIVGHADEENIRFAVHAGDIVCDWEDARQWQNAANVMGKLDGKIAYSLLAGYDRIGHQEEAYQPYVTGYAQKRMTNAEERWYEGGIARAQLVDTAQGSILMLSLSRTPTVQELRWADGILEEYEDIPAILLLNRYLNAGGETGSVGLSVRSALLQRHEQVRLVLCAHEQGTAVTAIAETCGRPPQSRSVPVLGLGASASPEDSQRLWILRLDEKTDTLTLESRPMDAQAAEPVLTLSTAGWFR